MIRGQRYVGFYVDRYNDILPTDASLGDIANTLWYQFIKTQFNDYTWSNYYKRELFDNPKFNNEDVDANLANIKKTLLIHLKSKARLYDRMFNAYMADFNPLWNVDGVVGEIRETNHTGTDTNTHTGIDTINNKTNGTNTRSGNEEYEKFGKEATTRSGDETTTYDGADVDVTSKTTYDSQEWNNTEKVERGYKMTRPNGDEVPEKEVTVHYGNVKDESDFTNRKDKHTYNDVKDTISSGSENKTTYDSTLLNTKALKDTDLFMQIRQGNIGVTKSSELLADAMELYGLNELMDFVHYVVNDCINQLAYSVY